MIFIAVLEPPGEAQRSRSTSPGTENRRGAATKGLLSLLIIIIIIIIIAIITNSYYY